MMDMSDKKDMEKRMFDCELCKKQKWQEKRVCFLVEDRVYFEIPIIEWVAGKAVNTRQYRRVGVNIDQFYELLVEFREYSPGMPLAEILDKHFRDVCPKSILDYSLMDFLEIESFCKEYGCTPFEGSMFTQPNFVVQAFNIIRATRNSYESRRQQEMKQKMEAQTSKSKQGQTIRKR